ncbi:ankyrin repeat domain-containing protein [Streptomyces sp. TRM66268-LWL]|uniref:Ankyrin repeat domain-containing protein n=1 Tax=Streptomyces polyasparticus TaxID=2767826 RepID=A0ABR7S9F1_9ACTN|nr:ankyrin repeat domain-containing protein [Streptomyces polyasparticus]MBC9712095.1 ankyrin repeat domain-containing protein [Streptomyces polyasparticus]
MQNAHDPVQPVQPVASALFSAVFDGDENAAVRLLRDGADPDAADEDGESLLYLAAMNNRPGIVRLLLAAGADPARLSRDADLPLCGAACAGHHEVVRALLAAGAEPDQPEEGGFTALAWAVQLGHADTAAALLAAGADPQRPGPDGLPPLVSAVRRGSFGTVRALLFHGARPTHEALTEARRWLATDVEEQLRQEVAQGADPADVVVRRFEEYAGITVSVEVLRPDGGGYGREQQTGHGAIATVLEHELGVRAPFGELLDRALPSPSSQLRSSRGDPTADPDNENWREAAAELAGRGDEVTYRTAAALTRDESALRAAFGVDVLGRLASAAPAFAGRVLALLGTAVEREQESAGATVLARTLVRALGEPGDRAALPLVLRFAGHADAGVRAAAAATLHTLGVGADEPAAQALARLTGDADPVVRHRATLALAWSEADSLDVRESLAARLADHDPATAAEAARGLARRGDPRAVDALARLLTRGEPGSAAYDTATEAVDEVGDERARALLRGTFPRLGT